MSLVDTESIRALKPTKGELEQGRTTKGALLLATISLPQESGSILPHICCS